jgi:hypothetical protein
MKRNRRLVDCQVLENKSSIVYRNTSIARHSSCLRALHELGRYNYKAARMEAAFMFLYSCDAGVSNSNSICCLCAAASPPPAPAPARAPASVPSAQRCLAGPRRSAGIARGPPACSARRPSAGRGAPTIYPTCGSSLRHSGHHRRVVDPNGVDKRKHPPDHRPVEDSIAGTVASDPARRLLRDDRWRCRERPSHHHPFTSPPPLPAGPPACARRRRARGGGRRGNPGPGGSPSRAGRWRLRRSPRPRRRSPAAGCRRGR